VVGKTYIIPVFDVSWINIVYAAELDPIGRNPVIFDIFAVVDNASKLFGKTAQEQVGISNQLETIEFGKGLTETPDVEEQHIFDFTTAKQDVARTDDSAFSKFVLAPREDFIGTADSASPRAEKNLTEDQFAVDELQPFVLGKGVEEDVPTSEITTYEFAKELADSADAGDEMNAAVVSDDGQTTAVYKTSHDQADVEEADVIEFGKSLEELKQTLDEHLFDIEKPLEELAPTSDGVVNLIEKPLEDFVDAGDELNNLFQTDDGQVLLTYKRLTDDFTKSDEALVEAGKAREDAISTADELQPFVLGKLIEDTPLTSEQQIFDTTKVAEDSATSDEQHAIGFNRPLIDRTNFPAEGPAQYDTYAINYFAEDYCRDGFPVYSLEKGREDAVAALDVETSNLGKPLGESIGTFDEAGLFTSKDADDLVGISDVEDLEFGKVREESLATSEAQIFDITKLISDLVDVTDDFYGITNVDDEQIMSFATSRFDNQFTSEELTAFVGKALSDIADTVDEKVFDFHTGKSDTFNATDNESTLVSKPRQDSFSTLDAQTGLFGKALTEISNTSVLVTSAVTKALADTADGSDTLSSLVAKPLVDATTTAESITTFAGKLLGDAAYTSDVLRVFSMSKSLSDSVDATDDFDGVATAEDDQTVQFSTSRAEVVAVDDASNRTAGKGLTEMVDTGDSGSLRMTDYCDVNYFAESYVGTLLNF
jgi:hypothetical protein